MSVSIEDLRPKPFTIKVKGVELTCKPPRLSHGLINNKIADVMKNAEKYSNEEIRQAERDMDMVISELIPELSGFELDADTIIEIVTQINSNATPTDNQELEKQEVKLGDPKAPMTFSTTTIHNLEATG